jgi:branched-chain amino acid transport system substrate-binding protein
MKHGLRRKSGALALAVFAGGVLVGCTKSCSSQQASSDGTSGASQEVADPGANGNAAGEAASPIKIGVAVAQTSNVSLLGQEQVVGVKLAAELFNSQGGIAGHPIELKIEDTAGDENGAINAFQTLITKHLVVGIVGPTLSQQAFSADPIADRARVPVLGPSNTAKGIPEIGDYIARVSAPMSVVAPNSIAAALKLNPNIKKAVVLFAQNDAFSKSETEVFQQALRERQIDFGSVQTFQTTDTDFQAQVSATLAAKPELVVISGLAADGGNLIRQLRELGFKGLIIGGNGLNTSNVFPVCAAACDGVLVAQSYSPGNASPANKQFRERYLAAHQNEPPQFTAQAFTGVQVFVEALRAILAAGGDKIPPLEQLRVELNTKMLAMTYDTPLGEISFSPAGEVIQKQFYVAQIRMESDGVKGRFDYLQ